MKRDGVPIIRFENVSVVKDGKVIFKDLNFDVWEGDKVLIYGESGVGKTTVLRLILGFDTPSQGSIYFEGLPLDRKRVSLVRRKVAYVSQDLDIGGGRVIDIIEEIMSYRANSHVKWNLSLVEELFDYFKLKRDTLYKRYESLSGGEKQRVCIVIALLLRRKIFLLDEVTSSLDTGMKRRVVGYFLSNKDWTVISVSHDRVWMRRKLSRKVEIGG